MCPPGRYDIDAESASGSERVRGITATDDAPYRVQVLSGSGRRRGGGPVVIAALELDGRFARAGHADRLPRGHAAGHDPRAARGLALILGAALSVAGIGLPLLLAAATFCRRLERLDRRAANRWLDAQVAAASRAASRGTGGAFRRSLHLLSDRTLWRTAAHLTLRPLLPWRCCSSRSLPLFVLALLLELGIGGARGRRRARLRRPVDARRRRSASILLRARAARRGARPGRAGDALPRAVRDHARPAGPAHGAGGPVREMLAESLGDRTVTIVYWLPDRGRFVDEQGHPVELPEPGSGAPGRPSTATAGASRRSSTTPRSTPPRSW